MKSKLRFIYTKYKEKQIPQIRIFMESFFATWSVMRIGNFHSLNILAFLFFFFCYICFSAIDRELSLFHLENNKFQKSIAGCLSFIFTIFYLSDSSKSLVTDLSNRAFQTFLIFVVAFGLYLLFYKAILFLMYKIRNFELTESKNSAKFVSCLPWLSFFFIVFCRIPWLLYSYPGIMTPDSMNQFKQVIGMAPFSNHHPWLHTLTISLFYHIGSIFTTDTNNAFLCFTIFQICFMAFTASYLIWVISKYTKSLLLLFGIIIFYGLLPYHNVMAICIWKDILFSGTLLLFCTSLFYLLKEGLKKKHLFSILLYFLSGFFMCLYRSNGWYAFLVTLPFLLIAFWKKRKLMIPLHIALLSLVITIKGPVMDYYNVEQPDFVESVSIPLQQVGRVIATGQKLTPIQEELIKKVIKTEYVPKLYTEYISDNMKELVRTYHPEYFISHKKEYLKLWVELGIAYPDIYLDAYIAQTKGYYSPSVVYSVAEVDGIIDNETGLYREYLISGKWIVKLREILIKLQDMIPLYGALWSMGSLFWGTLLFLGLTLGKTKIPKLNFNRVFLEIITPWIPNIAVIGTLLIATPVATEFRYAYNLAYCLPLYFAVMLITKENE